MSAGQPTSRAALDAHATLLRGTRLAAVRYAEIDYGGAPGWERGGGRLDALDFGLELVTARGQTVAVTWGSEFSHYGLWLLDRPLMGTVLAGPGVVVRDVTEWPSWAALLPHPVVAARVRWDRLFDDDRSPAPWCLDLSFSSGATVYVCAAQYLADRDELFVGGDEIAVVFRDEMARRYRVGPYATWSRPDVGGEPRE